MYKPGRAPFPPQPMNIISKLRSKHFYSLAGNIAMSVLGLLAIMILTRSLSVETFGIWVFFQSILILIDTFRSGFLNNAVVKFYAGTTGARAREVEGSSWYIAIGISLVITAANAVAFLFLPYITNPGARLIIQWFSLPFWVGLPFFMTTCLTQATERFDRLLVVRLISQAGFVGAALVLALTRSLDLYTLIILHAASFGVAGLYAVFKRWIDLGAIRWKQRHTVYEMFHYGKFTVGTTLSANLFRVTDTLIINFMLGASAMAIYNVGQRLMEFVEIPIRSFVATSLPEISAAYNRDEKPRVITIMKKYIGVITLMMIPACLAAFFLADIAVLLIAGGKYQGTEAANVFRLFMTFALLFPAERFFAVTLDAVHLPRINFYKVIAMLAANVIFDVVGVLIFKNVYGIALATVVPVIIGILVGYWGITRYYQKFSWAGIFSEGIFTLKRLMKSGKLGVA